MEYKIKLLNTENNNNIIKFRFEENDKIKELRLEYLDINIEDVPLSILNIIFVLMIVPMCLYNEYTELYVNTLDKIFYDNFSLFINSFRSADLCFNPQIKLIVDNKIIDINKNSRKYDSITLFSGGVDSYFTVLKYYKRESQLLLNIIGSDYSLSEYKKSYMPQLLHNTGSLLKLNIISCISNFRSVLKERDWLYSDHAIRILAHAIPLAWIYNSNHIYFSSGSKFIKPYSNNGSSYYQRPAAANNYIINRIEFNGTNILVNGSEYTRSEKIKYIVNKYENEFKIGSPVFHVCWETRDGKNCCKCEKCCRTIYQILEDNLDPKKYGFPDYNLELLNKFKNLKYKL